MKILMAECSDCNTCAPASESNCCTNCLSPEVELTEVEESILKEMWRGYKEWLEIYSDDPS